MSHSPAPDVGGSVVSGFMGIIFAIASLIEIHPAMQFAALALSILASSASIYKAFKR